MAHPLRAALLLLACAGALAGGGGAGPSTPPVAGVATLYRRTPAWADYAEVLAAVQLGQPATALHYVEGRHGGPPAALAVGDAAGGLHLLSPAGQLVAQHYTGTGSPVTALASYRLSSNTTMLLTGHRSGELRLHTLVAAAPAAAAPAWADVEQAAPQLTLALADTLAPEALLCGAPGAATCSSGSSSTPQGACAPGSCAPIASLHAQARGGGPATIVAVDALGRLAVVKSGGRAGPAVRVVQRSEPAEAPVAVRLSGHAAALLGSTSVSSQRVSALPPPQPGVEQPAASSSSPAAAAAGPAPREPKPCSGLNGSSIAAAAFDGQHPGRAYGLTAQGALLALVVGGERGTAALGCTVRSQARLPPGLLPPAQGSSAAARPMAPVLVVLPGYLLVAAVDQLAVFNTTAAPRHAPQLLLQQPLAGLRERFGLAAGPPAAGAPPLLAASRQGQHVALMLNATVLALHQVGLPAPRLPKPRTGALAWMQVLQPLGMVGVAAVVLYRARARRGGGGGGSGGREFFAADPRLREFERLLENPLASGATGTRRGRAAAADSGGSDGEDSSLLGRLGGGGQPNKRGLLGRLGGGGGGGGGGSRAAARSRRAAALASEDDAAIAAMRAELEGAELEGAELAGGAADMDMDAALAELAGGFGSDLDEPAAGGRRGSDEVSQLRQRFGQARIS